MDLAVYDLLSPLEEYVGLTILIFIFLCFFFFLCYMLEFSSEST
jgi:hypothetical protein